MPNRNKLAVCISSQAGCAMGCAFCATGLAGLSRSLTAQEMVDQVLHVSRDFGERVTSVVFMGQGEPFANFDNTVEALRMLNDPEGARDRRHVTSRSLPAASSLAYAALRNCLSNLRLPFRFTLRFRPRAINLCPALKKFTLLRLHEAIQEYVEKTGRRPTYEFAMIDGSTTPTLRCRPLSTSAPARFAM